MAILLFLKADGPNEVVTIPVVPKPGCRLPGCEKEYMYVADKNKPVIFFS